MAQQLVEQPLAKVAPCRLRMGSYVITVRNSGDFMMYPIQCEGEGEKKKCCSVAVLDLPNGTRQEIQCMPKSGMESFEYVQRLKRTLFLTLLPRALVGTPHDLLVLQLLNFIVDNARRHTCPSEDHPANALLPVAYIQLARLQQSTQQDK